MFHVLDVQERQKSDLERHQDLTVIYNIFMFERIKCVFTKSIKLKIVLLFRIREPKKRRLWSGKQCESYIIILIFMVAPKASQLPSRPLTDFLRSDPTPLA